MADSNNTGDMVYVSDYTRGDGTHVDDYYRTKPGKGSLAGGNLSEDIDVPNTVSNILTSFGNNKNFDEECPALTKLFGSASRSEMNEGEDIPEVILKGGIKIIKVILEGVVKVTKVVIETIAVHVFNYNLSDEELFNIYARFVLA